MEHTRFYLEDEDYELIVINNGNKWKAEYDLITKRIDLPVSVPYSKLFNQGFKEAKGDFIVLISNDVFIQTKEWLHRLEEALWYGEGAVVSPLILNDRRNYLNAKRFRDMDISFDKYSGESLPSHLWMIPKEDLIMFDEGYKGFNCEDDDYCQELKKQGKKMIIATNVLVEHKHLKGEMSQDPERARLRQMNFTRYRSKWHL